MPVRTTRASLIHVDVASGSVDRKVPSPSIIVPGPHYFSGRYLRGKRLEAIWKLKCRGRSVNVYPYLPAICAIQFENIGIRLAREQEKSGDCSQSNCKGSSGHLHPPINPLDSKLRRRKRRQTFGALQVCPWKVLAALSVLVGNSRVMILSCRPIYFFSPCATGVDVFPGYRCSCQGCGVRTY